MMLTENHKMDSFRKIDLMELPNEVLIEIFRNLPLEDRKNIRSTCNRFYELCDDSRIQNKEVIALYVNINTVSAFRCLSQSSRQIRNIKLTHVDLNVETIRPFFEEQGAYIRCLHFQECTFASGVLKCIIERCANLSSLSLKLPSTVRIHNENVFNDFRDLRDNSIVRKSVTEFALNCSEAFSREFLCFFAVFPRIKKLIFETKVQPTFDPPNTYETPNPRSVFSFSFLYDQLQSMGNQLEKLKLEFTYYEHANIAGVSIRTFNNIFNIEMKNLKQLSLGCLDSPPDDSLMNSSLAFKQLTHFNYSIHFLYTPTQAVPIDSVLLQLLLKNSSLRCLTLTANMFRMDRELFQALVKSKLITLNILMKGEYFPLSMASFMDFQASSLENTLMPNYSLQHLSLIRMEGLEDALNPTINRMECNLNLLFSTYFRSLKHLRFFHVHDGVLQNIFKYQTRIHSLHLCNAPMELEGENHFRELPFFQQWLQEEVTIKREFESLAYLDLTEVRYCLTNFLLTEFVFPNLKALSIVIYNKAEFDEEQLWQLIQNLSQLEYLKLQLPVAIPFQRWLALFKGLPKLRHVHMVDEKFIFNDTLIDESLFSTSEYLQLFKVCPTLRTVWHQKHSAYVEKCSRFFYDVTTRTVIDVAKERRNIQSSFSMLVLKSIPDFYNKCKGC